MRRLELRVEGRVQGVGFRFTTCEVARPFAVSGFVRNEPDGSVTIVAEGEEAVLLKFLGAMKGCRVWRYVTRESAIWGPGTGEWSGFSVAYG